MASYAGQDSYRTGIQSRVLKRVDWWLILAALVLMGFGLLALYSYGLHPGAGNFFRKQELNIVLGLVPAVVFATVPPKFWMRSATFLYIINLTALVLIFKVGTSINGSARWIHLGPVEFQPSEMAKLISILTVASFYAMRQEKIRELSTFLLGLGHIAIPMILIVKQPHFGGALVLGVIWFSISLVANVPVRYLGVVAAFAAIFVGVIFTHPELMPGYHEKRLSDWGSGSSKSSQSGAGYQTDQARMAF